MADLPTRVDFFNIGADEILARSALRAPGNRIDPDQVFTDGSDINIVTASSSAMAEEVTRQLALRTAALYYDGAENEELDRLVADRTNGEVVRKDASPATGTITISRNAGALPAVSLPVGTRVKTSESVEFETTAIATLAQFSTGPVLVPVQAVQAGLSGNVAASAISAFSVPPSDANLLVTNAGPTAGGDDREQDPQLRERAKRWFLAARRGTLAAIEFGALLVRGVRQATAIEETDAFGSPTGRVSLYIADAQGNGNSQLVSAVRLSLFEYRGGGVVVDIYGAVPLFVTIRYRLRFTANVDTVQAFDQVRQATVANVNALAPSVALPVSLLFATARSVPGVIVLDDAIVSPVGDLIPAPGQVIRTRADLVEAE